MNLLEYCKNKHLIIGSDVNAHHTIWHSTDINERGESLLELLITYNMTIINNSSKPTFAKPTHNGTLRKEVLDLTLTNNKTTKLIGNWRVSDDESSSDHMIIEFVIKLPKPTVTTHRCPQKTDWDKYRSLLKDSNLTHIQPQNTRDLNALANELHHTIINAYEESNKPVRRRSNREVPWWNDHLDQLKTKLLHIKKQHGNHSPFYRRNLTKYNIEIRKSKRRARKTLCETLDKTPETSRIQKALSKQPQHEISTLKRPDGSMTKTFKDTLELLLTTHFPNCTFVNSITPNTTITRTHVTIIDH